MSAVGEIRESGGTEMAKREEPAVWEGNVGAWVFQGNPFRVWRYFDFLKENDLSPGDAYTNTWTLHPSYRIELMQPDQLVILWLTGERKKDYWPGVFEIGLLNAPPTPSFGIDETHKVPGAKPDASGFAAEFDSYILPQSLRSAELRQDPVLAACEKFRVPMLGNPLFLTPRETLALSRYIDPSSLKEAGWDLALKDDFYVKAVE